MKFRKKPVVIDAIRFYASITVDDLRVFAGTETLPFRYADGSIFIQTLEGEMRANPGDWIIKGIKGEFYPCKPDIFKATYEPLIATELAECGGYYCDESVGHIDCKIAETGD